MFAYLNAQSDQSRLLSFLFVFGLLKCLFCLFGGNLEKITNLIKRLLINPKARNHRSWFFLKIHTILCMLKGGNLFHSLHKIFEAIHSLYPAVNKLITNVKFLFKNSHSKKVLWSESYPDYPIPNRIVVPSWGFGLKLLVFTRVILIKWSSQISWKIRPEYVEKVQEAVQKTRIKKCNFY